MSIDLFMLLGSCFCVSLAISGLQIRLFTLYLYYYVAFSTRPCLCFSCEDTGPIGLESTQIEYDLIFTLVHVQRCYFQIRSHSDSKSKDFNMSFTGAQFYSQNLCHALLF